MFIEKSMQALTSAVPGTMHTASDDCSVPGYNFSRMLGFDCSSRHVLLSRDLIKFQKNINFDIAVQGAIVYIG